MSKTQTQLKASIETSEHFNTPTKPRVQYAVAQTAAKSVEGHGLATRAATWLLETKISMIGIAVSAAIVVIATSFPVQSETANFNRKWFIFGALMMVAIGWIGATLHDARQRRFAFSAIIWTVAGFALHAGVLDPYWHDQPFGNRLAMIAGSVGFGILGVVPSIQDGTAKGFAAIVFWLWGSFCFIYFLNAPPEMEVQASFAVGFFLGVGMMLWFAAAVICLFAMAFKASKGTPASGDELPTTTVAHSKWATEQHVARFDLTDDIAEG